MSLTLGEIAALVNGKLVGDPGERIRGVASIQKATEGDLAFIVHVKYLSILQTTKASAVILSRGMKLDHHVALIYCENPSLAFSLVARTLFPPQRLFKVGIHKTAVIAKSACIGKHVVIGPHVVIEENVTVGDNAIIGAGSFIGQKSEIGNDTIVYPNVSVLSGSSIGARVVIHSGTVIGSDGYGFVKQEGKHHKIPQVGIVEIQDDVEIGSNVSIDRARLDKTVIGRGTKIDNLVQVAHNVSIGEDCLILAQVGVSGSTRIGDSVVLAGQVGLVGHIEIGDRVVVAAQSGLSKSVKEGEVLWGSPAVPIGEHKKQLAHIRRLPILVQRVKDLERKIELLEKQ